jgi:hypothetical protein
MQIHIFLVSHSLIFEQYLLLEEAHIFLHESVRCEKKLRTNQTTAFTHAVCWYEKKSENFYISFHFRHLTNF